MNLPSEQGTSVYHHINVEQTVLRILLLNDSPSTLNDWFNLDINIRNSDSISLFKRRLLSFIRPFQNSIYNIFDPKELTFVTRLRLGLSHLNAHRFRHNFQDCLNPLSSCSLKPEDMPHYLLHCHHF